MTDILSDTYTDKESWLFDTPAEPLPLGTSDDLFSSELSSTDLSVGLSLDLPPSAATLDSAVFVTPDALNAPPPPPLLMSLSAMSGMSTTPVADVKREPTAGSPPPPPLPTTPPHTAATSGSATTDEADDEFVPRKRRTVRPTRRALAAARDASSDGSSDDNKSSDSDGSPPKRRGRRAAAEIIKERMDPALLNGPPPNCEPAIRRVALTRERLLTIGSAEMEARCDELQSALALTPAEQKELRRQRRLVKNREYAQQSRNKKKRVLLSVDSTITDLQRENEELQRELAATQGRLAAALRAATALGDAGRELVGTLLGGATAAAAVSGKRRRTAEPQSAESDSTSSSSSAGGAALLVMLLSFGVSLAAFGGHAPADTRAAAPLVARETHTRAAPTAAAAAPSKTNRALLTCDDSLWAHAESDELDEPRANGTVLVDALVERLSELELDDTHSLPPLIESV